MTDANAPLLADELARQRALDTTRSFLVQAPAGSGKTELLAMRILKLLAEVEEPEQVFAITFARDATAEMRHRILKKLGAAKQYLDRGVAGEDEDLERLSIAVAALERSNQRGWRLLEQPHRLNIQTIDSLCLRIAHRMPLQARLSGTLDPIENAARLYREAARRTLDRLGGGDTDLDTALAKLLSHRDSNLKDLETLLEQMLQTRDQWSHAFPLTGEIDWERVKARFEEPLRRANDRALGPAHALLSCRPEITSELLELATYACNGEELKSDILALAGLTSLPSSESPEHWMCIANLLLKKGGDDWLVNADKRHGFPAGKGKASFETRQKDRRKKLINDLQEIPRLLELLCEIRSLPPLHYSPDQWEMLQHMFTALRQAVRELNGVFADEGAVDFVEISTAALQVLQGSAVEFSAELGIDIRHLLVDEFQDTSRRQHSLLSALVRDWSGDDGRTVFFVGDPMQSIYMFRQADVELFDFVRRHGLQTAHGTLPIETLRLTSNFRSARGVVEPLNEMFQVIFPFDAKAEAAAVVFLPGVASNPHRSDDAYRVHPDFVGPAQNSEESASGEGSASPAIEAQEREVHSMMTVIRSHLPALNTAKRRGEEFTIAVLARVKNHLAPLGAALRNAEIPFRAVELEGLGERQEILDLLSLTRALLHPMDRIAWLAMLRAPWCGLMLRDLHLLCGTDEKRYPQESVQQQIVAHLDLLDEDSRARVSRLMSVVQAAFRRRYSQSSFGAWIERSWHSLGGPACVDATGYENALTYFRMLQDIAPDGIEAAGEKMDDRLGRLFSQPDPGASERCGIQLMTMHKAKGLGFNVVLIPSLHRPGRGDDPVLIRYLERSTGAGTELLVAPVGIKGEDSSPLNNWVRRQQQERASEERKRLLYVACTRAREELHLFGTASRTETKITPKFGSLLQTAWPSLEEVYRVASDEQNLSANNVIQFPSSGRPDSAIEEILPSLAASAAPNKIRRLPSDWATARVNATVTAAAMNVPNLNLGKEDARRRPDASRTTRTLGNTVHVLFEQVARLLLNGVSVAELRATLPRFRQQALALARNEGLSAGESETCANTAVKALDAALQDDTGRWLLGPRLDAQIETSWTAILDGKIRTFRIDRSFRAGAEILSEGSAHLWIVDYKTAVHSKSGLDEFLEDQRELYRDQLEAYGRVMQLVYGNDLQLRLGLYYPLLKKLDWWVG